MLASNPRVKKVKDRLTALKQEKAALKDTWFERNDLLNESQDLQVSFSWLFLGQLPCDRPQLEKGKEAAQKPPGGEQ